MSATLAPEILELVEHMIAAPVRDRSYELTRLGPAVREYLSYKRNEQGRADETLDTYERVLARLAVRLATRAPADLTLSDLRAERDSYSIASRRKATAIVRDFSRWLHDEGHAAEFVAGRLRAPAVPPAPITDLYSDEEKAAIVNAQTEIRDRACVLLLLRAGLRKGELRQLRVRDLDLRERIVLVRRGKGAKHRRVPIRGSLVLALEELLLTYPRGYPRRLRPDEFVLYANRGGKPLPDGPAANPSQGMSATAAHRWWYGCLERAGVVDEGTTRGRRMHATRHTYATDLGRATNWNMLAVQKNLGHARIETTVGTYTQFSLEDQAAAVEMLPEIEGA